MTTIQKSIIATTLAVVAGTGIYEARQASQLREQNQTLQQHQAPLVEQLRQLQRERDDATNRLASLIEEIAKIKNNNLELLKLRSEVTRLRAVNEVQSDVVLASEANSWIARVGQIKKYLEQNPEIGIPELKMLTPGDWLNAGREPGVDDEIGLRKGLKVLRDTAKARVSPLICDALKQFTKANGGRFPTDVTQLKTYFDTPLDDVVLARYTVLPASEISRSDYNHPGAVWLIAEKAPVDVDFDTRVVIGENGRTTSDFDGDILIPVIRAFQTANKGAELGDASQLLPYAQTPDQQKAVQRIMQRIQNSRK
jgi:hypothetical protein